MESTDNVSATRISAIVSTTRSHWLPILALGLLLLSQRYLLAYYWGVWNLKDSYYSHGPMVPALFALMLWLNKGRLRQAKVHGSPIGIALLLVALALYAIGFAFGWKPISGAAFLLFLYGAILSLLGIEVAKVLFLPVLFLATMMPVPEIMLDNATGRYQIISSAIAARSLQALGNDISRDGNIITSSALPEPLVVGSPCSGLKLLMALVMSSWFLSYILEGSWKRKITLVLLSLPFSILVNSIRIILIGAVGVETYSTEAMHSFHDYSGYIGLLLCAAMVYASAWLLHLRRIRASGSDDEHAFGGESPVPRVSAVSVTSVVLLAAAVPCGGLLNGLYDFPKGHIDKASVPGSFGHWAGVEAPIDSTTQEMLRKGDLLSRVYINSTDASRPVGLFMDASLDRSGFHDPHLCLPGSGNRVVSEAIRTLTMDNMRPRPIPVNATILRTCDNYGITRIFVYWYTIEGRSFARNVQDMQWYLLKSRIGDLRYMLLHPLDTAKVRRDILSRQITWYRFSMESDDPGRDEAYLAQFVREFIQAAKGYGG